MNLQEALEEAELKLRCVNETNVVYMQQLEDAWSANEELRDENDRLKEAYDTNKNLKKTLLEIALENKRLSRECDLKKEKRSALENVVAAFEAENTDLIKRLKSDLVADAKDIAILDWLNRNPRQKEVLIRYFRGECWALVAPAKPSVHDKRWNIVASIINNLDSHDELASRIIAQRSSIAVMYSTPIDRLRIIKLATLKLGPEDDNEIKQIILHSVVENAETKASRALLVDALNCLKDYIIDVTDKESAQMRDMWDEMLEEEWNKELVDLPADVATANLNAIRYILQEAPDNDVDTFYSLVSVLSNTYTPPKIF